MFTTDISNGIKAKNSHICIGLDSDYEKLPVICKKNASLVDSIFTFNKAIIDATHDITPAYKPNMVFYSGYGIDGLIALKKTNEYIKTHYPDIKLIIDCKRSEMKRSAELAAKEIFEEFLGDAIIVTPWFGYDTIEPYQQYQDKAVFVLCHDSNPSAGEIQDVQMQNGDLLYEHVTKLVCKQWNSSGNILVEAPLTYPTILKRIHKLTPSDQFFLIAGLGAQGGDIKDLKMFQDERNFIVNASRSVIFASSENDFDIKARTVVKNYNEQINNLFQ